MFPEKEWFSLDNAAKVFPGQNTSTWSNVFRMTAVLNDKIDPEKLKTAVKYILPRFPCFDVEIHRGIFWYYYEKNRNENPPVMPDINNPCTRIKWHENARFLFRVYYHENRISVEFYHALTDAYGVSRFLCTLTAEYLRLCGHEIPPGYAVLDLNEEPTDDEMSDASPRFATSKSKPQKVKAKVYYPRSEKLEAHDCHVITGFIPIEDLKKESKKYGVTLTEYCAALLIDVIYHKQLEKCKKQKYIGAQVPVNLRNTFKTDTLRNFSLCFQILLNPNMGEYSFEEILKHTALTLRDINNEKQLNAMISSNMKLEKNIFTRMAPLFLKNLIMSVVFGISSEGSTSTLFSNMGLLKVPDEMTEYVKSFILIPPHGIRSSARVAAVGYNGNLVISFTNVFKDTDVEREFFRRFVKLGIHVKIESNDK